MTARAKRIYLFDIVKVNKLFWFFFVAVFSKRNRKHVFCVSTRESLGELEKAVETLACGSCSHSISRSPKLPLVFLQLDRNTVHVSYFLNNLTLRLRASYINHFTNNGPQKISVSPKFVKISLVLIATSNFFTASCCLGVFISFKTCYVAAIKKNICI